MKNKIMQFMAGRYGSDDLNRFTLILVIVLLGLDMILRKNILFLPAFVLMVVCYIRMFSKNHGKRFAENQKFLQIKQKVLQRFQREKHHMAQRKSYHFYSCPQCRQKIRIPKGKGHIRITCPKCSAEFEKNS